MRDSVRDNQSVLTTMKASDLIKALIDEVGGNQNKLARILGVPYKTVWRWKIGAFLPDEDNQRTIARVFNLGIRNVRQCVKNSKQQEDQ